MRTGQHRATAAPLLVMLFCLAPAWAELQVSPDLGSTTEYEFDVIRLKSNGAGGRLTFSDEQVVYLVEHGRDRSQEWTFSQIQVIQRVHHRLLRIELVTGGEFEYAAAGPAWFDNEFRDFVRENADSHTIVKIPDLE